MGKQTVHVDTTWVIALIDNKVIKGPTCVTIDDTTTPPKVTDPAGTAVRKFPWLATFGDPPPPDDWLFSTGTQHLDLTVPGVLLDDGKGHKDIFTYRLSLFFKWDGEEGIQKLVGQGGVDPTHLLVHAARLDLVRTQTKPPGAGGAWNKLVHIAEEYGMQIDQSVVDIVEIVKPLSKEEKLELEYLKEILQQKATVQKYLFEHELAIAVSAKQAEQWATNYERVAKVKTDYMMAMNAVAKGAGGRDRAYSRVAACCCCSVASKVGASIWGSGEVSGGGEGSFGIGQDFSGNLGLTQSANGETKTDVGNKIKFSADIETTPPDPPPSKSGPLKMALLTVPPAPGDAVGATDAALNGPVQVPPAFITSAAGTGSAAGKGAALELTFDKANGTVTAIGVTGPGKDYEAGNTLTVNKQIYAGKFDLIITISQDNIVA